MIDAIINAYGKPWQTLCTIQSMIEHSGGHIDKIFLIREKEQPYDDHADREIWRLKGLENIQLVFYTPRWHVFQNHDITEEEASNKEYRYGIRYQYGIEHSNKKYVLVSHNDVLYQNDIVGKMILDLPSGYNTAGIGHIGQCWNCPGEAHDKCTSEKFGTWVPTFEDIVDLGIPHVRTHANSIDRDHPFPLPECRLNEWCAIINRDTCMKECKPVDDTPLFGSNAGLDTACGWFKSLYLKGYKFKHFDINKYVYHGYWARNSGYPTQLDRDKYFVAEEEAMKYWVQNYE